MIAFESFLRACRAVPAGMLALACQAAPQVDGLVASWDLQVPGDSTQRTLRITHADTTDPASPRVFALIGYRGKQLAPMRIELDASGPALALRFTTPLGARADVRQVEDGSLEGQWTVPSGAVRPLRLIRMAPGEDTATTRRAYYVVKPAADVPAECAALSGLWSGEWKFIGITPAWVWVLEVDADCKAKMAYQGELARPGSFQVVDVRGGTGTFQRPLGSFSFSLWNGELRLSSTFNFAAASNVAQLKRVPDPLP